MNWKELPDHSRVWIYQAERLLTAAEVLKLHAFATAFLDSWNAHGTPLRAAIEVMDDLFVVIMVDEAHAKASGCSIDKSMAWIKAMETELGITLTNRMIAAYQKDGKLQPFSLHDLPKLLAEGVITEEQEIVDNLVSDKSAFLNSRRKPLKDSWLVRFAN